MSTTEYIELVVPPKEKDHEKVLITAKNLCQNLERSVVVTFMEVATYLTTHPESSIIYTYNFDSSLGVAVCTGIGIKPSCRVD